MLPSTVPWHVLGEADTFGRMLLSLARTPPHIVANFLQYAEKKQPAEAERLLVGLLADPSFAAVLARASPGHGATFLQYAEKKRPAEADRLLVGLLADPSFAAVLARAPPGDGATFLQYAEKRRPAEAETLLANWWVGFQAIPHPKGHEIAGCGPILLLAHACAPCVADEMVAWLNQLGEHFIREIRPVHPPMRWGLVRALKETDRWLDPQLFQALVGQRPAR